MGVGIEVDRVSEHRVQQHMGRCRITPAQRNQPQADLRALAVVAKRLTVAQEIDHPPQPPLRFVITLSLKGQEPRCNARPHAGQFRSGAWHRAIDRDAGIVERLALFGIAQDACSDSQLVIGGAGQERLVGGHGQVHDSLQDAGCLSQLSLHQQGPTIVEEGQHSMDRFQELEHVSHRSRALAAVPGCTLPSGLPQAGYPGYR